VGVGGTFGWGVDPFGECRFLLVDVSLGDNVLSGLASLDLTPLFCCSLSPFCQERR
jgi:hypothetical protein